MACMPYILPRGERRPSFGLFWCFRAFLVLTTSDVCTLYEYLFAPYSDVWCAYRASTCFWFVGHDS